MSGLAFGLGLAVLQIVLATVVFQRVHQQAVQSGLLARYSAESSN
jgi:ABC-2 type transport system permease protein